jgi:hypothetical protein
VDNPRIKKNSENLPGLHKWGLLNEKITLDFPRDDLEFDLQELFAFQAL